MTWWLQSDDGVRLRVGDRGLLLGRRADCDVVLTDPKASAVHALLLAGPKGLTVRGVGRNPTLVDGQAVALITLQKRGELELPGARFLLVREGGEGERWTIEHRGRAYGLGSGPLVVGSGPEVDLRLPGWPPRAVELRPVQGAVVAELMAELELEGRVLEVGEVEALGDGDRLCWQQDELRLRLAGDRLPATVQRALLPISARLSFLPTGGRLDLAFASGQSLSCDLPELRARLVAILLQPPAGYQPGEFVGDEVVLSAVWPGRADRGRTDINTLVHRTRKDLARVGINPGPILLRAPGGGGAALKLARGASVEVS